MKTITKPIHLMSVCEMIENDIPLQANTPIDSILNRPWSSYYDEKYYPHVISDTKTNKILKFYPIEIHKEIIKAFTEINHIKNSLDIHLNSINDEIMTYHCGDLYISIDKSFHPHFDITISINYKDNCRWFSMQNHDGRRLVMSQWA